jgi:hypothetical protein
MQLNKAVLADRSSKIIVVCFYLRIWLNWFMAEGFAASGSVSLWVTSVQIACRHGIDIIFSFYKSLIDYSPHSITFVSSFGFLHVLCLV